jgi:membrane-associated phospholipid phosphatase
VFAAMPSLHSAYMLIAFIYSLRAKCPTWMRIACAVICLGIWFTAVYTSHHYILDVMGGIGVTILGFLIFEYALMRIPAFSRFINCYAGYISKH